MLINSLVPPVDRNYTMAAVAPLLSPHGYDNFSLFDDMGSDGAAADGEAGIAQSPISESELARRLDPWEDVFESDTHRTIASAELSVQNGRPSRSRSSRIDDDVWGSSGGNDGSHLRDEGIRSGEDDEDDSYLSDIVSDVPKLRSMHTTAGYRDGISESKGHFIQEGFDEGYALGGEIGRAVGYVLGGFEGIVAALASKKLTTENSDSSIATVFAKSKKLLARAREELGMHEVFSETYIQQDGLWRYDVLGDKSSEDDITFERVAHAHPLVVKWQQALDGLSDELSLDLTAIVGHLGEE